MYDHCVGRTPALVIRNIFRDLKLLSRAHSLNNYTVEVILYFVNRTKLAVYLLSSGPK